MVERRSLGQAIDITPEKLAFIQGQDKKETSKAETPQEKTVELERKSASSARPSEPTQKTMRRTRNRASSLAPTSDQILDQVLVPVTIRLQHRTSQALKRAYLEQRLHHSKPDTQQEIVEEAVSDWLQKQGFLD